jgi:hypothetical protein
MKITYSKEGKWREQRLKDFVSKLVDKIHLTRIKALHDHKGNLEIYWKTKPSIKERAITENIWINDFNEAVIEHL